MKLKLTTFFLCMLLKGAWAQTPWPETQAANYPQAPGMTLTRHEQSILLGDGDKQTGLFFANIRKTYSENVYKMLVADAQRKRWTLQTVMRDGTRYILSFSRGARLLDIRLSNRPDGVDAVYSISLNQQDEASENEGYTLNPEAEKSVR